MELAKKKKIKCIILNVLSCFLAVISIVLGIMIYAKKDENASFLKENFNINVDFTEFNENVSNVLNSLFTFGIKKDNNETKVNKIVSYINLGDNQYKTVDKQVLMLDDGIILGTYKEKNNTFTILVSYNNGVVASYSNLNLVNVKTYDKLDKEDVIGSYEDTFKALFKKEGKLISINEISES